MSTLPWAMAPITEKKVAWEIFIGFFPKTIIDSSTSTIISPNKETQIRECRNFPNEPIFDKISEFVAILRQNLTSKAMKFDLFLPIVVWKSQFQYAITDFSKNFVNTFQIKKSWK